MAKQIYTGNPIIDLGEDDYLKQIENQTATTPAINTNVLPNTNTPLTTDTYTNQINQQVSSYQPSGAESTALSRAMNVIATNAQNQGLTPLPSPYEVQPITRMYNPEE